jgi:hypothetical protein
MSDERGRSRSIILERRARFVAAALAALSPAACKSPAQPPAVLPAACPSAPLPVDSDGDGVLDRDDKCPREPAPDPLGLDGCPRVCLTIIQEETIVIHARVLFAENVATPPPSLVARGIADGRLQVEDPEESVAREHARSVGFRLLRAP